MTAQNRPPTQHRRRKRWFLLAALLLASIFTIGHRLRQDAHQRRLIAEIRAAGGKVRDSRSLLSRIRHWYEYDIFPKNLRTVNLEGGNIDHAWLRDHDWLSGMDIQALFVDDGIAEPDLIRLIQTHPLREFYGNGLQMTDGVANALAGKRRLQRLGPTNCRLTDDQFARLPLEQFDDLSLVGTEVTPNGLQQLRRCKSLNTISLDGTQFTGETADVLASLRTVTDVSLSGGEVTDVHLDWVLRITTLRGIRLNNTNATQQACATLEADLPYRCTLSSQ